MTVTDPTFYRSAADAAAAPREQLAYVVAFDRAGERPDALTVIDVDEESPSYGTIVGWADLPTLGDELHHFGWNACSSALKHEGHDMTGLERRYLLLPVRTGAPKRRMRLALDGQAVREFDIELADGEPAFWAFSDVGTWKGRKLVIEVDALPEGSRGLASVTQGDDLTHAKEQSAAM